MKRSRAQIETPCEKRWGDLEETTSPSCRFCTGCQKDVHHLSKMTEKEARALVEQPGELCVIYDFRGDEVVHKPKRWFSKVWAALLLIVPMSPVMTACGGMPRHREPEGALYVQRTAEEESEIDAIKQATVRSRAAAQVIRQIRSETDQ